MVEVRRLSEQDIYDNFSKLRSLIYHSTERGGGNADDYTRLLINSIVNPHVLAAGIFQNNEIRGLFLAIVGLSYSTSETAAYIVLLSLDPDVRMKTIYSQAMQLTTQWMKEMGTNTLIGSSPRSGFYKLLPTIDKKWQIRQILVLETE